MIFEKAPAKINLALHVLGRRLDGYHDLDSIVAFADVGDELLISESHRNSLRVDGAFAEDVPLGDDNIIWKAWRLLSGHYSLPFVTVGLTKNLPVASGIGGGSADAAAMVRGLLRLVDKTLPEEYIVQFARTLGADVPVCFYGKACRMTGIGESISVLTEKLPEALVLMNPRVGCSTLDVFRRMNLMLGQNCPLNDEIWRNDMTEAALLVQPIIRDVLHALENQYIGPVRMSGSGATCFAEATSFAVAENAAAHLALKFPQWWVKAARLV